jgi:phosphoglucosamine mutase
VRVSFGTDGVRGVANQDITPELTLALGRASVRVFGVDRVHVGRDTRISGSGFEAAVVAGVCAEGAEAVPLGVVPTPAVAHATRSGSAGVVISASHNVFSDNGLKVFAPGGSKLTDAQQENMEKVLAELLDGSAHTGPTGAEVGNVVAPSGEVEAYADSVLECLEERTLGGLRVVIDAANGANHAIGVEAIRAAGAEVVAIHDAPDGTNINNLCGSTHPESLQAAVVDHAAHVGIAFDGDADRLLASDEKGNLVDGDQLLALFAVDLRSRGLLAHDTVVVTVMSNLGFRHAMAAAEISVVDTAVGDRYVLEAMAQGGFTLGGEQSGHIIERNLSTTGDGLLSALMLLDLLHRTGRAFSEMADECMTRLPQVLLNVGTSTPIPDVAERLRASIESAEAEMDGQGRVLLRPSGTEPVIRVMVEAPTEQKALDVANQLASEVASI